MFAIVAAVAFAIALIMDLADVSGAIGPGTLEIIGFLCLALHMAGLGTAVRARSGGGRWSFRR